MSQNLGLRLCLVVLLCLSGCNAFDSDSTETASITPAGVPTDDPNATRGLAPGLTNHGVVSSIALGDAHEAVLSNTSFTIHEKTTVKYSNGTLGWLGKSTTSVVPSQNRYYWWSDWYSPRIAVLSNSTVVNRSYWSEYGQDLTASYFSKTNTTTYENLGSSGSERYPRGEQYYTLFQAVDTKVINHTTNNGTTLYRLASNKIVDQTQFPRHIPGIKNTRNLTFHAVIDSRGVVHEYRFAYTATLTETLKEKNLSTSVRVVSTTRYTKIGSTTVERPSWYAKANRTTPEPPTTSS